MIGEKVKLKSYAAHPDYTYLIVWERKDYIEIKNLSIKGQPVSYIHKDSIIL